MKHDKIFLKATAVSIITLFIYQIAISILEAMNEKHLRHTPHTVWLILSIFLMVVYVLLYIWMFHILRGDIRSSLYGKDDYHGFGGDIVGFIKSERAFFLTILLINVGCWGLWHLERLFIHINFLSLIQFIYTPLKLMSAVFPSYLDLPAVILSSILIYLFYILTLAAARKITYNKMFPKNKT